MSSNGIQVYEEKVKTTNANEEFFGLTSFFKRYFKDFYDIVAPVNRY